MLTLRPLMDADIPAALRLSTQAGWNQLEADWLRLLTLWPAGCLVGSVDGRVVATGSVATFGPVGWLGMVLVDESQRGKGHGGAIFDALLQLGERNNIPRLGLDATDLGRPVYLKRGFVDVVGTDRWACAGTQPFNLKHSASTLRDRMDAAAWSEVLSLDRAAVGVDRAALLRHLAGEANVHTRIAMRDGRVVAFGLRRPGRNADAIAPVIAHDRAAGEAVIASLAQAGDAGRSVFIDVPRDAGIDAALTAMGFSVARRLTRMVRPAGDGHTLHSASTLAGCGFELG